MHGRDTGGSLMTAQRSPLVKQVLGTLTLPQVERLPVCMFWAVLVFSLPLSLSGWAVTFPCPPSSPAEIQ